MYGRWCQIWTDTGSATREWLPDECVNEIIDETLPIAESVGFGEALAHMIRAYRWFVIDTSLHAYPHSIFFIFRLLPFGVATADSPSPFCSILRVFLRHFHCCHVLSHRIHKPPFRSSPFLFPGSSIVSVLLPIYPAASFLSTCPNHLGLASRTSSPNGPTCAVPLMYSFLVHSCHS